MSSFCTDKQKQLLRLFRQNKLKRINILQGAVRSGKTWVSLVLWALWVATRPKSHCFLMAAKTLCTLKRNVLELLSELVGEHFTYNLSKKEGRLFGRLIYLESACDMRSDSRIRGLTIGGAYCDELTLFPEDFFTMLLSRMSPKGAKLFATTNPDSPAHWLKKNYIDRSDGLDLFTMTFSIDDNCFLDSSYVANLKNEFSGVFYERFIRGRWVAAEGLVYPMFDEKRHVKAAERENGLFYISIDYGTVNPFSMGLWMLDKKEALRIREFYYDSKQTKRQKTDEEYYEQLEGLAGGYTIQSVVIDPCAASFIETIRRHGRFSVKKADNHVLDGIRTVSSLLSAGKLFFHPSCRDSIREFSLYSWEQKAGEDKVVKEFDHAMDEIRYFCNTILRREFKWDSWAVKEC